MNLKDALEFLELPATASDSQVNIALLDKLRYFQKLMENAPNDFLRNLYSKNIEKIKGFMELIPHQTGPAHASIHDYQQTIRAPFSSNSDDEIVDERALAFLIRHNEQQPVKTYPLYAGINIIGRTIKKGNYNSAIIDDDNYVSRVHAVIEIKNGKSLEAILSDTDVSNGGKASKNGTYVNGNEKRLTKAYLLNENDTIQIGMTKLILRYNNGNIDKLIDEVEDSHYMKTVVINLF